ncbi:hypothetical protein ACFS27_19710 [Promicromonospora vindobonensis]|uniref:Copper chaperone PCu(A)C n=1 Tax=Promicromonospora vindobonensis TaxID=195748 RepID=A0ABW5VWA0_9MICO
MTRAGRSARAWTGAAAVAVAVAGVSACAESGTPPPAEVRITTAGLDPVRLETATGGEVRFVNRSDRPQRVVSLGLDGDAPAVPEGAAPLDSGRLVAGATFAARLEVPGEYVVEAVLAGTGTRTVTTIEVEEPS